MKVKICGLTNRDDAAFAETHGADFLGVILAGGPRLLDVATAAYVLGPRRHTVRRVAVFGTASAEDISDIARRLDLDIAQLHGDPSVDDVVSVRAMADCAVWPVVRVEGTALPASTYELAQAAGAVVLDAKVTGQLGGTGVRLDWAALADDVQALRARVPGVTVVLAGGLKAANVEQAIGWLAPDVVDVSSGVEAAPGIKDTEAIVAFVRAAQNAARGNR